ncbi:MAG TPA: sulfotransferase [Actinoplanes sp.]|nr:sulfotransferase [Actinoplanes sp.]
MSVLLRDRLKTMVPTGVQDNVKRGLVRYGELTSGDRPLPDFLIIGTKRGGTTSLWNYLLDHPLVPRLFPAWNTKSAHYFDEHYNRGEAFYRSHFPTARQRRALERRNGGPTRVGEAAPLYMFRPGIAERVAKDLPAVKLIVLLRDPVERAFSHWKERTTEGAETLSFADALAAEDDRTAGEYEKLAADPYYVSNAYDWYTYRARGRYLEHLHPWLDRFDAGQLLVLASESLYREPEATYGKVLDFLGLPQHRLPQFDVFNHRRSAALDPAVRAELAAYYAPHNAALADRLQMSFDW